MVSVRLTFLIYDTYSLLVLTMDTKCPNKFFYVWLVDLQAICGKYGLETWFSPNDIRKYLLDIKHDWSKNAFWAVNNKKWRKWCKFVSPFKFKNPYGLLVLTKTPNVLIKFFTFDYSL
jgi:hypothetical protein